MSPLALGDDCRKRKNMGKKVEFKVCGLSAKYFVPLFLVIIICTYGGFMPTVKIGETTGVGMVGTLAFLMSVGGLFFWLGNSIPVVNSYLGGSVLFCMFGPALLNYFGLLPETTVKGVSILMKYGLQDVYIAALLCGSVLYMDRKIIRCYFPLSAGDPGLPGICTGLLLPWRTDHRLWTFKCSI